MTRCYVDVAQCRESGHDVRASTRLPGLNLFYSYGACNASDESLALQLKGQPEDTISLDMRGRVVKIATSSGAWSYPAHFQTNASCCVARGADCLSADVPEECLLQLHEAGNRVPWQGYKVDYLNDLISLMGARAEYQEISHAAVALFPKDWETAAVQDVHWGLSDMSTGAEVTAERLSLGTFSRDFEIMHFHLFVPKPSAGPSFLQVLHLSCKYGCIM